MAEQNSNAAARPSQGVRRSTTHSGVTHVRTYQSGQYVVIGNHLAQHRQLSLTAIGLATHILSLPEGALVDIRSLAERFPEGRERIGSGPRELEEHGYLERVRERSEAGRLVTRTYAHHTPERAVSPVVRRRVVAVVREGGDTAPRSSEGVHEPSPEGDQAQESTPTPIRCGEPVAPRVRSAVGPEMPSRHHDKAVALLTGLRRTDDRLTLSSRDVHALVPGVVRWFERGATAHVIHRVLTFDLPVDMRRAAGVLGYRLGELLPPPLPAVPAPSSRPTSVMSGPDPFQTCDGCERAFRAPHPGRCRDCRSVRSMDAHALPAA
ncbi:helix-turn-helix domain-containing protein [Streptomyces parvulus]|uniref:Helix-turn-helix domain-containing protein n=1 Tax=Streptomyces parvulus TaxID=146923 RepID=A0A369UYM2_9ACTN|nr:helix-turn-helix domain-containing protein [Streptomyces parvulus]